MKIEANKGETSSSRRAYAAPKVDIISHKATAGGPGADKNDSPATPPPDTKHTS